MRDKMITENLARIRHRIVVFSGKGGVGKTTISVNLAYGLQSKGNKTGLLDADVTGPNVPQLLGLSGHLFLHHDRLIPQEIYNMKVISIASMIPSGQPVIWRGPMRSNLLDQFLGEVEWGPLDYLVADLPPGTGDEILTMTQKMEPDLAVIVTTPQEVSLVDSARAINMAKKMEIPNIGVIENMSGLICPECGANIDLFGSGGGKKQAEEHMVSFLGELPMDLDARKMADEGKLIVHEGEGSEISVAILDIADKIAALYDHDSETPDS
ncbi:Mrp/NBP35 family ATP-binding protein [Candidatus Neomarinimicrobiota bacterium]